MRVELTRFDAFDLYKACKQKGIEAKNKGLESLAEIYFERSQNWLDIACEIEATNSDGNEEYLMNNLPFAFEK